VANYRSKSRRRTPWRESLPTITPRGVGIAVVGLAFAFVSTSHSLAQIFERPVLELGPIGQHSNGKLASIAKGARSVDDVRRPADAMRRARETMRFAPMNAAAPRTAGMVFSKAGKKREAERAMLAAVRLTRRDGTAQLWLANAAIARRDLPQVLHRYDLIMRTHPAASPPMYDTLARTLADPVMRKEMKRFVSLDTPWFESFASSAAASPANAKSLARLFLQTPKLPDSAPMRNVYAAVMGQLGAERQYALVEGLYPRLPGAQRGALGKVELPSDEGTEYPPVAWARVTDGSYGAAIVGGGKDRLMELYVSSGAGGVAARKLLVLRPGAYNLHWRAVDGPGEVDAEVRAIVSCADAKGAESVIAEKLIRSPIDRGGEEPDPVSGDLAFTVPAANCPAVLLDLRVGSGASREEARWLFDRLSLAPLKKAAIAETR